MESIKANEISKTGETKKSTPVQKKEVKKTVSQLFLEECDEQESEIFEEIKQALISKRDKYEFEAVTEDMFNGYRNMITYIKGGVITLLDEGVNVKLRKPLFNNDGIELTKSITILYERNQAREDQFRKTVSTNEKSKQYNEDITISVIAASFENIGTAPLSSESLRNIKRDNYNDYELLLNVYMFFRS